jgi:hypothetical protein
MGFFEIGSHKLFVWAGFKPRYSLSLSPELIGVSHWLLAQLVELNRPSKYKALSSIPSSTLFPHKKAKMVHRRL